MRVKRVGLPAEFWQLAAAVPRPYGTILILAILVGLRKGELEALRWNDNSERGKLRVNPAGNEYLQAVDLSGTPEWTRTTDLLLRRQTLYPAELQAHTGYLYYTGSAAGRR